MDKCFGSALYMKSLLEQMKNQFIATDEEDLTKNVKSFKYHGAIININ